MASSGIESHTNADMSYGVGETVDVKSEKRRRSDFPSQLLRNMLLTESKTG